MRISNIESRFCTQKTALCKNPRPVGVLCVFDHFLSKKVKKKANPHKRRTVAQKSIFIKQGYNHPKNEKNNDADIPGVLSSFWHVLKFAPFSARYTDKKKKSEIFKIG